jgi:hypothetical protein
MKCYYPYQDDLKVFEYRATLFTKTSAKKILHGYHLYAERTDQERSATLTVTNKEFEKNAIVVTEEIKRELFLSL